MQLLLLEALPCAQALLWIRHRVIRAGIRTTEFLDRAEMSKNLCAVDTLPHEGVVRQAVVLTPADLDGHEIFQTRLLDQLGQCPCITEYIGQPQDGAFCVSTKVFAEEGATQQELTRQRLGAAQV